MKTIPSLLTAVLLTAVCVKAETASADPIQAASDAFGKNDLEKAETLVAPLAEGATARPAACALLGDVRLRQKRTKEAVELFDRAAQLDPKNASFQSRLGVALSQRMNEVNFMQQGMLAGRMLGAFKRSIELDPDHVPGYIGLARYYAHAPAIAGGDMETAVKYAGEAQKRDRFSGTLELGFLAEQQDQFGAALKDFEEALQLHPGQAWLEETTAKVLVRLNRPAEARVRLEKALALEPGRESARRALAGLPAAP
jgi:Flp pilus assembly protein TadD